MRRLPAVERAREIMKAGMEWSVWKWLLEKKRVRGMADEARAALDELEMQVKGAWSDDLKIAYNQLISEDGEPKRARKSASPRKKEETQKTTKSRKKEETRKTDSQILAAVKRVKEADDEAYNAHEDAEDVFAKAERKMSTSMAREGARMALIAYDVHEAAIGKAEALVRRK
jgi:hypothetical protein